MASASVNPLPLGVFTVYSTQNAEQSALAQRFEAMAMATQPSDGARVRVRSTELQGLQRDDGSKDTFRSVQWYRVLVRKVTHWAELAAPQALAPLAVPPALAPDPWASARKP